MRKCFKWTSVIVPAVLIFASGREANAQIFGGATYCINCADEPTALSAKVQQILQYIQEAATALNTYQHLQLMIREVQQLIQHPSTNIAFDLATFSNVLVQSQAVAANIGQMDSFFTSQFAPYSPVPGLSYAKQYVTWANTALNALHSSANSAAYQGNMMQNEQQFMAQMNLMNQQSNGMDQSLQIANALQLEQLAQSQRLRMLLIANTQQTSEAQATDMNAQAASMTAMTNMFTDLGVVADQTGW